MGNFDGLTEEMRILHEKLLSSKNQKKFAFVDPAALQSKASNSTKLTLDLITWLNKANEEFLVFPYLKKQHHWVLLVIKFSAQKAWWLDPAGGKTATSKFDNIIKSVSLDKRTTVIWIFYYEVHDNLGKDKVLSLH
ncbi:uncharacterized protein LOC113317346 [Papaver somniferum]|uniref:uncharacterized protein LOC113317346 n=1 Tax=Papaver somniferum TaxID=3469 RepID=UPI000E6F4874|nr:uncharacterized protein LOC113317346 [Papaver somniferum]